MSRWVCALSLLSLSASKQFYYSSLNNQKPDSCTLCYTDNDCLVLDQLHCDYYVEVDGLLHTEEVVEPVEYSRKRVEVDDLLHEFAERAVLTPELECIPFLSQYTNCHKENVCIGCVSCTCSARGSWNCEPARLCHTPEPDVNIDHRVLTIVMEKIRDTSSKRKRSTVKDNAHIADGRGYSDRMSYQQTDWTYGDDPRNYSSTLSMGSALTTIKKASMGKAVTTHTLPNISADADYVEFDDVLQNIAIESKNYTRRKPPLDPQISNNTNDGDNMIVEDLNDTRNGTNDFGFFVNLLDDDVVVAVTETATAVVVDLLKGVTKSDLDSNFTDNVNLENSKDEDITALFSGPNDVDDYSVVNIMKRDVSSDYSKNDTTISPPNITDSIEYSNSTSKDDILRQLNKIISERYHEINDLKSLKNHLLTYFNTQDIQKDLGEDEIDSVELNVNNLDDNTTTLEVHNEVQSNPDLYKKYLQKIKADIFQVLQDVIYIQKYKTTALPKDIVNLVKAMKSYASENKFNENYRRNTYTDRCVYKSFKDCLIIILQVIDRGLPAADALSRLSVTSQKIVSSIIKNYYTNEFANLGLRVNDKHYNLRQELESIGTDWFDLNKELMCSNIFELGYRMKLINVVLNMDIIRMRDALTLITFAQSRRIDVSTAHSNALQKINEGFEAIRTIINKANEYYSKNEVTTHNEYNTKNPVTTHEVQHAHTTTEAKIHHKKKYSFLRYIKNLLKHSKDDIAALMHDKLSKADIVKQLALNKLDQLTKKRYDEYLKTMSDWQGKLNLVPRSKRSIRVHRVDNMKGIIPKYLRHKVRPKIFAKYQNGSLTNRDAKKTKKNKSGNNRKGKSSTKKPRLTKKMSRSKKSSYSGNSLDTYRNNKHISETSFDNFKTTEKTLKSLDTLKPENTSMKAQVNILTTEKATKKDLETTIYKTLKKHLVNSTTAKQNLYYLVNTTTTEHPNIINIKATALKTITNT